MTTITYPVSNAQGTADITSSGTIWVGDNQYLTPATDTYPTSISPLVYLSVPRYTIGIPEDLYVLTSNRGYVTAAELGYGDVLLLTLTSVAGTHSTEARPSDNVPVYQVVSRFLALPIEGTSTSQIGLNPQQGSYVTWTPGAPGDLPPNTPSTPLDQIACLCLLPGVLVSCPDVVDLTSEVDWVEQF